MDTFNISLSPEQRKINDFEEFFLPLYFPLSRYNYSIKSAINNFNRWYTKIVCVVTDESGKSYVSTTYTGKEDYLKFIKTIGFLETENKLIPKLIESFPQDNSVICEYTGNYLYSYLKTNPDNVAIVTKSIFDYLKELNMINQCCKPFQMPSIINDVIEANSIFNNDYCIFEKTRSILPELVKSKVCFSYGYGIEDPHIWNFRILSYENKTQSFTTDYDYFTGTVNYFWEFGYFYGTLRWIREKNYSMVCKAEKNIQSLVDNGDLKTLFMFWLGVLSSYCGYRDSIKDFIEKCELYKLKNQISFIEELDNKVSFLAKSILEE